MKQSEPEEIPFCTGGGCTAKLGPDILERVLSKLPKGEKDPKLLVGYDSHDDVGVYQVGGAPGHRADARLPSRRWWRIRISLERSRRQMP